MANPIREDLTAFGFGSGSGSGGLVTRIETLEENVETLEDDIDKAFSQMNYSSQEHVVGEWIDGRTIYEKTFHYEGTFRTSHNLPIDIDYDLIISQGGFARRSDSIFQIIPNGASADYWIIGTINGSDIQFRTGTFYSSGLYFSEIWFTVRYVKTE